MADPLLSIVLENLNAFIHDEIATFYGVNKKIKRLSNSLKLIQAVIEDAEQKEITSKPIKIWLQQLKDATHVLDDILDEYSIRSLSKKSGSTSQVLHCLSLSSFKPKNIRFRYGIGKRLKDISERLDQIAKERKDYGLIEGVGLRERPIQVPEGRQTGYVIEQPKIYGRDKDKEKIVEFLVMQAPHSRGLSVFPIVGLGGLGKTTLAQFVFNDPRVSKHFGTLRIWVCISDDFSVVSILQSVMESITSQKCDTSNLATLQKKVQEKLLNQRYLLVLDDVWNQSQDKWYQLRFVLECGSNGASVLVTTRDYTIASFMGTHPAYQLSSLSEDDCWSLFKQRAFPNNEEVSEKLEEIGREIVNKCGGLPLAAKALGSVLQSKKDEKQWLEVKESELWKLPNENGILPALRLSYFSLTPTSRRCFAFCAIFPKDEVMDKEALIHLWMANGFISSRERLDIEDVGNEIWEELCHKSFFQEVTTKDDGSVRFKMHDLVHDIAQSVTEKECFFLKDGDVTKLSSSTHHIGYIGDGLTLNEKDLKNVESLRTLFNLENVESLRTWFNLDSYSKVDFGKFQKHYSLRALSINSPKLPLLHHLIHLRYLAVHGLEEDTILTSICSLRKLEILKFESCDFSHLPEGLTNLQNLRHLIILRCYKLSRMPPGIGKLSGLKTLSLFIVRPERGHSLKELHGLNLCQRELSIEGLECVGNVDEAKGVNLIGKNELRVLSLSWGDSESEVKTQGVDAEQVIEALQPHSNLKILEVRGYKGSRFPSWMKDASCMSNLQLDSWKELECIPEQVMEGLRSLRTLDIYECRALKCLPEAIKHLTSLERLKIRNCPMLVERCKEETGEDWYKIQHIPHIDIYDDDDDGEVSSWFFWPGEVSYL